MGSPEKPCILNQDIELRQVLALIADKWTALVIYALARGTMRYGQLQRDIQGVSQRMLTRTLRALEQDGLVERKVYPAVPPMVEYSLTPLGETLVEPLTTICRWAQDHLHEVALARSRYNGTDP